MDHKELYQWKEKAEEYLNYDFTDHLNQIKLTVLDGWVDASKAYLVLDQLEKQAKAIKEAIRDHAVNELEQEREINGFKLQKVNSAGRWDYSKVEVWNHKKNDLKALETNLQNSYRSWERGQTLVDENGEVIPVPAYIPGKETVKITKLK